MENFTQKECENIIFSIKSDDLTSFCKILREQENLCFGRFPLLSVCLLYNSKRILKKYRKSLEHIKDFCVVFEPFFLAKDFMKVAGKSMRLYQNKIVYPIEMLALFHKDFQVKKTYYFYDNYFDYNFTKITFDNLQTLYSTFGQ